MWCNCSRGWASIFRRNGSPRPERSSLTIKHFWQPVASLPAGVDAATLPHATAVFNLVAFLVIAVVTTILVIGIQESATINSVIVFVKVGTVLVFIAIAAAFVFHHFAQAKVELDAVHSAQHGHEGRVRMVGRLARRGQNLFRLHWIRCRLHRGAGGQEPAKGYAGGHSRIVDALHPALHRHRRACLPASSATRGLNVGAPIALGMAETGVRWGEFLVLIGTIMGLSTVMLVMLLGQSRVFFSMSRDGLLPHWAGAVHPRFRTPWISSIVVGVFVAFLPAMLPIDVLNEMTSIGTLLAFVIVCAGVWVLRVRRPDLHRPFKTPLVPAGADSGHRLVAGPDDLPAAGHLDPAGGLADHRNGDLPDLRPQAQQRSAIIWRYHDKLSPAKRG